SFTVNATGKNGIAANINAAVAPVTGRYGVVARSCPLVHCVSSHAILDLRRPTIAATKRSGVSPILRNRSAFRCNRRDVGIASVTYSHAFLIHLSAGSLAPTNTSSDNRDRPEPLRDNIRDARRVFRGVQ